MRIACQIKCDSAFQQLHHVLADAGFECERFPSEAALLRAARRKAFDLMLVETNAEAMEDGSLYSWLNCRTGENTAVVLLSPACTQEQIVHALNAGADDFISRPCEPSLILARLHAVLRRIHRGGSMTQRRISMQGFVLDRETVSISSHGVPVDLTPREFMMAWLFFSTPGTYMSRETISTAIWGVDSEIANRTIEQHVYMLRKKLNLSEERGVRLRTAYSKGYRLELVETAALVA